MTSDPIASEPIASDDTSSPPALPYDLTGKRVWVAGHRGMVGQALCRRLEREDVDVRTVPSVDLDLRRREDVEKWMTYHRPEVIIVAAATVGGIMANSTRPAEFLYNNLMIETSIIHTAYVLGVEKLLFLGSSCIYPRMADQPITEEALLTGPLEPTNEAYALAKIAGIRMCDYYRRQYGTDFISAMPTNLYGPGDNYDLQASHVVPALMQKVHTAIETGGAVEIWGTGTPRREFLHVDDLADACVFLLRQYSQEGHINVGAGFDIPIGDLARLIGEVAGFEGEYVFDTSMPDGMPRKWLDCSKLSALGWTPSIDLKDGLADTYQWYMDNVKG